LKYYNETNLFVPIVEITMPMSAVDEFRFAYHTKDQKVPIPKNVPSIPKCTKGDFDLRCSYPPVKVTS
jgi:hypothetical protein